MGSVLTEILNWIFLHDRPILEWLNFVALGIAMLGSVRTLVIAIGSYLWAHDFTPKELQDYLNRTQSYYNVIIALCLVIVQLFFFVASILFLLTPDPVTHIYDSILSTVVSLTYMLVATVLAMIGVLQLWLSKALRRIYDAWQHGRLVVLSSDEGKPSQQKG